MSAAALPDEDPDKSMETILASIRRIISEEEPAPADPATAAGQDVLELDESMVVMPEPSPVAPVVAAVPAGPPMIVPVAAAPASIPERLLAPDAQHAAARAFEALADANRVEPEPSVEPGPALFRSGGPTLEDLVRDELRGQLKSWLDTNLAPLVQRMVQKEIDELRRRG